MEQMERGALFLDKTKGIILSRVYLKNQRQKTGSSAEHGTIVETLPFGAIYSGRWFGTFGLFFPSYWEFHHPN
jgi:hypothetical protein